MIVNHFRCLFCLTTGGPFTKVEHPIPESLGNDDVILPPGYVCDRCNQYFGTKLEQEVLNKAPFSVFRVSQAIRNKKWNLPLIVNDGLRFRSTGYWDRILIQSNPPHRHLRLLGRGERLLLNPEWANPDMLTRFLLKIGLEVLAFSDNVNPYAAAFDSARHCARRGNLASEWEFAFGLYPDRGELVQSSRLDEIGPLETRQIYQFEMGVMDSGDLMFNFIYETACFAVNLSRPPSTEYILGFNVRKRFALHS